MAGLEPEGGCRRPVLFVYVVIGAGQLNDEQGIGTAAEVDHRSISRSCAGLESNIHTKILTSQSFEHRQVPWALSIGLPSCGSLFIRGVNKPMTGDLKH